MMLVLVGVLSEDVVMGEVVGDVHCVSYCIVSCAILEQRAKVGQTYLGDFVALLGNFDGEFVEKIWQQAPYNYSAALWTSNFSICLWEREQP